MTDYNNNPYEGQNTQNAQPGPDAGGQQNPNPNQGYQAPPPPSGYQPPQYGQGGNYSTGYYQPVKMDYPPQGYQQKSRLAAALLAFMFGTFGVHNFYLGFKNRAVIQLVVSIVGAFLTCGVATAAIAIWGFVEGVQLIIGNEEHRYDGNGVILRD